jgi:cytochrome c556
MPLKGGKPMRKLISIFLTGMVAGFVFAKEQVVIKKPPKSLGKYYPPQSQKWEFLSKMHNMSTFFYGINLNINDGNWERALEWAKRLEKEYTDTAKMVPEWKDYFKPELAKGLIKAVESKNVDRVLEASRKLGQTCAKCHADNEIAVKLVYHFPSFESIKLEDPIEFMEMETGKYMKKMTNSLKAMKIYLMQGDAENAQQAGEEFVERARVLKSMCSKCHTSKVSVEAITGKDYSAALDKISQALSTERPNREEVFKALSEVSVSCAKCHNVHLVPAMVREAFEK